MKNNKGFTLIELVAVVAILGIIALITIPIISDSLKKTKDEMLTEQIDRLSAAARKYAVENDIYVMTKASEYFPILIGIEELRERGYIEDGEALNPITEEVMNGCIMMQYDDTTGKYSYSYNEKCTLPVRFYTDLDRLFYERESSSNINNFTLDQLYNNYIGHSDLPITSPFNGSENCYSYTMTGILIDKNDDVATLYDGSIIVAESIEGLMYIYRTLVNANFDIILEKNIGLFIDIDAKLLFVGEDLFKNNPSYADEVATQNFMGRFIKQNIYTKEDYCQISSTFGGPLTYEECLEVAIAGYIKLDNYS